MFVYAGKSIDTFEDVWNMWMRYAGVDAYVHADVLSFRCFAFSCGEDVTRWFSPMQSAQSAIAELCNNLGIQEACSIVPASAVCEQLPELEWPILLADVCLNVEKDPVREQFYPGTSAFYILHRHRDGKHLICTSSGIPFMELSMEQVREEMLASRGYVVIGKMPMRVQPFSAGEILRRGIRWRKKTMSSKEGLERLCAEDFDKVQGRYYDVSVQYGLMNYQVQLSKVVRFCAQEMRISESVIEELNDILLKIAEICGNRRYEKIAQTEEDFWTLVEKAGEVCHV